MMWWSLLRYSIWLMLVLPLATQVVTFSLPGCNSGRNFDIVQNQQPSLTCTGLTANLNIYWSITNTSDTEIEIAKCKQCNSNCPPCSDIIEGYNVSRESDDSTTLQFLNPSLVTDGSTIKCSRSNNKTKATCRLFVVPAYAIPQCKKNEIKIKEGMQTPIICEGLLAAQNMYWTITYDNGTVSPVAECNACSSARCPSCVVTNVDFSVTREDNSSTLVIQNNVRQKNGTTLKCSKGDNKTHDDCTINVQSHDLNQERAIGSPVAAVAVSVVGCVVIVAIVIVTAVIFKRRKSKREATKERQDSAPTGVGAADNYDGLHMPDVGQQSVYSDIEPRPVGSSSGADYIDLYHGLDMSEVGQRSEYSQLGHNI